MAKIYVYFPPKLEFQTYHVPIGDLDQIMFTSLIIKLR